jgi:hypothetical protein
VTADERPPIGGLRLVDMGRGYRQLALDIARQDGKPVAVVGPGAVDCSRCGSKNGDWCKTPKGHQSEYPHMERVVLMNREIDRLLREAGEK